MTATTAAHATPPATGRPLQYLPVALFGASMGLIGLSAAWRLAHARFGLPLFVAQGIALVAVAAFVALAVAYGVKAAFAPDAVRAEFRHAVGGQMFGLLVANLLLLLPIVLAPLSLALARGIWGLGAVLLAGFLALMADRSLAALRQARDAATPALVVPAVGLLDLPLAAPALNLPAPLQDALVACWALGLALSVPLLAAVLWRLVRGAPLPAPMLPTLLIPVGPAAVGAAGHAALGAGHADMLSLGLFIVALVLLAVLAVRMRGALGLPFKATWWATSFPLAAVAIVSLQVASGLRSPIADGLAAALLALASAVIGVLLFHTLRGLARGRFREIV